jgi:hypothetical protein
MQGSSKHAWHRGGRTAARTAGSSHTTRAPALAGAVSRLRCLLFLLLLTGPQPPLEYPV